MAIAQDTQQAPTGPAKASAPSSESPEWQLVQRIVGSPAFIRSTLLTNFLLYVCDRKLQGREDEVTEHQIGVHALGRQANYHPGEDNIVRNYARILRKRLEEFFENEGKRERMRIVIPRGQYVPIFEPVSEPVQATGEPAPSQKPAPESAREEIPAAPAVEAEPSAPQTLNRRRLLISASMTAALASLGWFGFHKTEESLPSRLFHSFWTQMFSAHRECFVVTGDSGLVQLERMTGQDIPLNKYVNGTLSSDLHKFSDASPLAKAYFDAGVLPHYTTTTDLNIAIALDRLAMSLQTTPKIRNARDMQMDEVKHSNCIFIGGPRANPWIQLFEPRTNFEMRFYPVGSPDHATQSIWNKRPKPGEQQEYVNSSNTSPFTTYTIVSFLPGIEDEGWALLLRGQSLSGTSAAGNFVTDQSALSPVLNRAKKSDGSIGPFEVILETRAVGPDASKARILVERYDLM